MLHRVVCWLWAGLAVTLPAACVLASTGGEAEEISLNPLSWEWIQQDLAIWTAVVFVVLLFVLTKFAWKPLIQGLDQRERNMADHIAQAEAANQKARDILADYERKLAAAQEQVRGIVDQGRRDAEQVGRELIDKAKDEAKAEYERGVKQIDAATNAAIKELAEQSATLAVDLAGKIVQAKLNVADHARLIDQAVAGFVHGKSDVSRN
jgi:F-type H+-transporting ATPase subunit b